MNKLVHVSVFVGALLLVMAAMALLGMRSGGRRALQKYQAELATKGERLTFAELTRGRQTNVVDSQALLTNATAKLNNGRIAPGLLEPRRYAQPGRASVAWREASPRGTHSATAGSGATWEEFAAQMQAAQVALREIREALKHPAADAGPCTNMLIERRVNFVAIRIAAQWLMGAAENELHQGRLEAGLQDLEAMAALARMERDEYTLVAQMIRVAVTGLGLAATWDALQAPGWTEPQLARLQATWKPVDLAEALETACLGERARGFELFTMVRRSGAARTGRSFASFWGWGASRPKATFEDLVSDYLYFPAYKLSTIDADELLYLKTAQENVAALRSVRAHRSWPDVKQTLLKAGSQANQRASVFDRLRYPVSTRVIPNYVKADGTAINAETERQMTLAAIALKRFQLRHGQLPPSVEALVPELMPAVPYDYMCAEPLRYRLKTDGSYVLYSVGLDGKDDGGDPGLALSATPGLWGGRDAVWPSPATE
jgi:hypothetical protein